MLKFNPRGKKVKKYPGKNVWWIVLTGGPCSGKTTGEARAEIELDNKGYKVFFVDEAATRVINSGIKADVFGNYDFQTYIAETQIVNEAIIESAIEKYAAIPGSRTNIVVICDRGIIDGKAYMDDDELFSKMLKEEFDITEIEAKSSYNVVVHMVTAADGAEEYYTLANNKARKETPEEARAIDKKTFAAWSNHPHVAIIDNSTNFVKKIDRVMERILSVIDAPVPIDSYKKYLISMPNLKQLEKDFYCKISKIEITRTYLVKKDNCVERSVVKRGSDGEYAFYYMEKTHQDGFDEIKVERRIDEKEYNMLISRDSGRLKELTKTRYGFVWNNKYYELDVFDFWKDKAILKVQHTDRSKEDEFPGIFNVRMDITNDESYTNYSLAQNIY